MDGSRKNIISLLPNESDEKEGLRYQLYKHRFAKLTNISLSDLYELLPISHDDWIYYPDAGQDFEGYQGFIKTTEEVDHLVTALQKLKL